MTVLKSQFQFFLACVIVDNFGSTSRFASSLGHKPTVCFPPTGDLLVFCSRILIKYHGVKIAPALHDPEKKPF